MAEPEKIPIPETPPVRPESAHEAPEQSGALETPKPLEASLATAIQPVQAPAPVAPSALPVKDETTKGVESVLEEGLMETYKSLDPGTQKKFREEGDRITREIVGMIRKMKAKARRVLDLIRGWLRIIPHVNRHFLEQEAKIKTDRIMRLSEEAKAHQDDV